MNCFLLAFLVDHVQIFTPIIAGIGLFFVWLQIKKQTEQLHSDRLLSLYHDLDTPEAQVDRKFLYNEFPQIAKPTDKQEKIARRVLASFDRMSYQVIRKFADRKSAYDLYGRVLMRVMLSTWQWLNQERQHRNDPQGWEYCGNAERLAKKFAEQNLRHYKKWKASYKTLQMSELLEKSLKAHEQEKDKK